MTKSSGTHDAANFDPSTSMARLVEASLLFPSPPSSSTDLQSNSHFRFQNFQNCCTCSWPKESTAWALARCCATSLARDSKTGPTFHKSPSLLLEPQPSNKIDNLSFCQKMIDLFHIQLLDLPLLEVFQTDLTILVLFLLTTVENVL